MLRPLSYWQIAFTLVVLLAGPAAATEVWNETALYRFAGGSDGTNPHGEVIQDDAGNIFGTTTAGGGACTKKGGCGTVFKLAPDGTETVLYSFQGGDDSGYPYAGLVEDQDGNLYGTTTILHGTVFKVTPAGVHTVLHAFGGRDGTYTVAGLISDQAGNLYGTAASGGDPHCYCGTVFRVTPAGDFSVLYTFEGGSDGSDPQGSLVADSSGNLYGTTGRGGDITCSPNYGCGTIFKLTPDGQKSVLYAFHGGQDGTFPNSALIFDATGNLYGTMGSGGGTGCGGSGCGYVFRLAQDGTKTTLATFEASGDLTNPRAGVVMDGRGNLYGTGELGGGAGCGGVFKVAPGKAARTLYSFTCGSDGAYPEGQPLLAHRGLLLGTTHLGGQGNGGRGLGTVYALQK